MAVLAVPYHLDERLDVFDVGVPVDAEVTAVLGAGGPWERMAVLYERVGAVVAEQDRPPFVVSGDCTTSLGVLAGLQRAGRDVGVVWFDAHGQGGCIRGWRAFTARPPGLAGRPRVGRGLPAPRVGRGGLGR